MASAPAETMTRHVLFQLLMVTLLAEAGSAAAQLEDVPDLLSLMGPASAQKGASQGTAGVAAKC